MTYAVSMSTTRYSCDYAKRVSACKKCKLQLPKGALRLAKITPNPFVTNEDGPPPDMKAYFHANCLFETFYKARATTKVIEEPGDIEEWSEMTDEDKEEVSKLIDDLMEVRGNKTAGKTPKKKAETPAKSAEKKTASTPKTAAKKKPSKKDDSTEEEDAPEVPEESVSVQTVVVTPAEEVDESSKYNEFNKFCKLCDVIASVSKYTEKSGAVKMLLTKDGFDGDVLTWIRLLLPITDQRVYNIKEKQIIKHFSTLFDINHDELMNAYKDEGDVSITIRQAMEKQQICKVKKSDWSIQKVDRWLTKLTEFTRDEDQMTHLKFAAKRLPGLELMYLLRMVKKDLRLNAGVKHILDGLHPSAYQAFQNCRDLAEIIERYAEACKSVEQAMKRCPNGMFSEIKYDGERVQVHKSGNTYSYFSRSLKPVQHHKISQFESFIPKAFEKGVDLILDAEVLMVDTTTGKPLPFGTLGVHKKEEFKGAEVCLFVFDILKYNDQDLTNMPICDRKVLLENHMVEVRNHVMMSNYQKIKHGDNDKLKTMIWKAIDEGLEGLVLKDIKSVYEPGKRHWLKVKKDYLEQGKMADTADLIVLGAYFGTGSKGGMMSVFLMGVHDPASDTYRTVTKCGNGHTDEVLDKINKNLKNEMRRIDRDYDSLPTWMRCSRGLVPDFVVKDPKKAPVWEITGAEFSKSDNHTAGGVSIRFPRVTRVRTDKDWKTATNLTELKRLFDASKVKCDIDRSAEDEVPLYAKDDLNDEDTKEKVGKAAPAKRKSEPDVDDEVNETTPPPPPPSKKTKKEEHEEDEDVEETAGSSRDDQCPSNKSACKYGAGCYRKNAEHIRDFWHPKKK